MDADDWLRCPTPLEMYQRQCSLLVGELVETKRMPSRTWGDIAGLVQMNDLLMTGKAEEEEEKLVAGLEKISMLEQQCSPASAQGVKIVPLQRD